ncbi:MAG: hypothetical protein ACKPJK_01940 [Microcystis panniformis]
MLIFNSKAVVDRRGFRPKIFDDDKKRSYTDYSILVMALRLKVFEVFAFDEHIYQMAGLGIMALR